MSRKLTETTKKVLAGTSITILLSTLFLSGLVNLTLAKTSDLQTGSADVSETIQDTANIVLQDTITIVNEAATSTLPNEDVVLLESTTTDPLPPSLQESADITAPVITVSDSASNEATSTIRTVEVVPPLLIQELVVDTTAPVIVMNGVSPVEVIIGTAYIDEGAVATDDVDPVVLVDSLSTVDSNVIGTYSVTYTATDAAGNVALPIVRIVNVVAAPLLQTAANTPPVVEPIPDQNVVAGEPVTFTVSATDIDGDVLIFSLGANAPSEATIDPSTGVFSWTPPAAGTFAFDILVSDGINTPVRAIGHLIENRNVGVDSRLNTADDTTIGGMATWAVVKAQARDLLGIALDDMDALNLPLLAVDAYGKFIPGPNGFPQIVMLGAGASDPPVLIEGNPSAPVDASMAVRSGHPFLADIAHSANPVNSRGTPLPADSDGAIGLSESGAYDNELLDAHYIAGDGRVNENIGLISVHHLFHSEHNRLADYLKNVILGTGDLGFLGQWLAPDTLPAVFPSTAGEIGALRWDGERLFQAARFLTEMQYQHLVFEEFARKIQPEVNVFTGYHTEIDPAIAAEFAHTVYRFGHTIIADTIGRINFAGVSDDVGLIEAFLNPLAFTPSGVTPEEAAGAIVRGTSRQVANEIDEFVTEAVRNNLLGLPLDLASINLARGRDTGVPSLNAARRQFFAATGGNSALRPYESWMDFAISIKHPESLVNFIAAYGTHPSVLSAETILNKRAAASLLVLGGEGAPDDRRDFLESKGVWANDANGITITGLDDVDFWIGGLAEATPSFGGLLGTTFNFVFETQMEKLQDGDRLYYLSRTAGLNFLTQLEQNSFAELIMRNTDLGAPVAAHVAGDIFSRPNYFLEVDQAKQFNDGLGNADPVGEGGIVPLVVRGPNFLQFNGDGVHAVLGGSEEADILTAGNENDTVWGDGGKDRIEGGNGDDLLFGGDGDDFISDKFGSDITKGGKGNDVINGGPGNGDLILGGPGRDFIIGGSDPKEIFGGTGNDFIIGGDSADTVFGNEGDDWIEGGAQADLIQGDSGDPFQNSATIGNDVIVGNGGDDDSDSESGDDIMVAGPGIERNEGMLGFDWVVYKDDPQAADADMFFTGLLPPSVDALRDRFDLVEALSGGQLNDILRGDDRDSALIAAVDTASGQNNALNNPAAIGLIDGLQDMLGSGVTSFSGGNLILGGGGGDTLEGRGGDDIIDGDAWLNVRLSVRDAADPNIEISSANSITELQQAVLEGSIHPGQIAIVREILVPEDVSGDVDTAVFAGFRINYTITRNADGTVTVADNRTAAGGGGGGGEDGGGGGSIFNGTDTLRNIERLQFADRTINLSSGFNSVAAPTLSGILPLDAPESALDGEDMTIIRSDLEFILKQIKIAEASAAGAPLSSLIPKDTLPWGLRTVDGTLNNIVPEREDFGSALRMFPRLTAPVFRPAENVAIDLDGPGPLAIGDPTSYIQTGGFVFDSRPRVISNLIVDQTINNPAAAAAAGPGATPDPATGTLTIPNVAPDEGLSAPFNIWFMFFGQFFDHGLDLVSKGGSGVVFMPLQPDDPLFNPASPQTNFMVLTRATNQPGPDGLLGTADDIHEHTNQTTPFVDQNQTYSSHPSHQVFLRAYEYRADRLTTAAATTISVSPAPTAVASVHVSPDTAVLQTGGTLQFTAEARDVNDTALDPQPTITWSMQNNDASVGSIDANGLFTAIADGTAVVVATMDGISGTADIAVGGTCQTGADTSGDGIIDNLEILNYVRNWKAGTVPNLLILRAINLWKSGNGC